jgi:hypothetical protein
MQKSLKCKRESKLSGSLDVNSTVETSGEFLQNFT